MKDSSTEQKILKKSVDLFSKKGFARASIRDIGKAVGISNSTLYHYFKNKDEILYKIIEESGDKLLGELNSIIETHSNPFDCIKAMIFRQISLIKEMRNEIKVYMEEQYQLPPRLRKKALRQHKQIYDIYYGKICELKKDGLIVEEDETVITFAVFALMNWVYRWFRTNGRLSIEEVAEAVTNIFLNGVIKEKR